MNKANILNASVPLTWEEDDAAGREAKRQKIPKAGVFRLGLYELLKKSEPRTVKLLIRIRLGCQVAIQKAASIFTNLPPAERKPIFDASVEELEAEKASAHPNGDRVTEDCVSEFRPEGQFLKAKGVK